MATFYVALYLSSKTLYLDCTNILHIKRVHCTIFFFERHWIWIKPTHYIYTSYIVLYIAFGWIHKYSSKFKMLFKKRNDLDKQLYNLNSNKTHESAVSRKYQSLHFFFSCFYISSESHHIKLL